MSLLSRLLTPRRPPLADLWDWITATAREPVWYLRHAVPDTVDGRFDMVAMITSLVMLRLDALGLKAETALLTERFVEDMDGSLRDIGIGDMLIGKQMGKLIGALGGRVGAYREALAPGADPAVLAAAIARNVYRSAPPEDAADDLAAAVRALDQRIAKASPSALRAGDIA